MRQFILSAALITVATAVAAAQRPMPPVRPGAGGNAAATANFTRGQIVNVNANAGMMTIRTGTGAEAREQQFRFADNARFLGTDRRVLSDGLRFNGFKAGTDVFFRPGTGELANTINELALFDPSKPVMTGNVMNGQIVNVDARNGTVVIRTGTGANARERRFHMDRDARFFNRDLAAIEDGLAFNGFAAGAPVWFTMGTGDTISSLSLANPVVEPPPATGAPTAPMEPGVGVPIPSKYLVGQIVGVDAEGRTITIKTGRGEDAREMILKVPTDATFFGKDSEPLQEGLRSDNIKPGIDVWMRVGTGELANTVRELTLHDPNKKEK